MIDTHLTGPFILDHLTGQCYLNFLWDELFLYLKRFFSQSKWTYIFNTMEILHILLIMWHNFYINIFMENGSVLADLFIGHQDLRTSIHWITAFEVSKQKSVNEFTAKM